MSEKAVVTPNYTPEQTAEVIALYQAGTAVEAIALAVGHSVKSVIAKLVREKVYVSKAKVATAARVTKATLIAAIAAKVNASEEALESLEKATKEALELVLKGL